MTKAQAEVIRCARMLVLYPHVKGWRKALDAAVRKECREQRKAELKAEQRRAA